MYWYTTYGVLVTLPDGSRVEVATEEEAIELLQEPDDSPSDDSIVAQ